MPKRKVLVADDEPSVRKTLTTFLKSTGMIEEILEASNGQEAVETARANPDLKFILMDLKMPVQDGLKATEEIRSILPEVKIAILTGYPFYGEAETSIQKFGVVDFIVKPVDLDYLEKIINALFSE